MYSSDGYELDRDYDWEKKALVAIDKFL
jgi:hypothetical protein